MWFYSYALFWLFSKLTLVFLDFHLIYYFSFISVAEKIFLNVQAWFSSTEDWYVVIVFLINDLFNYLGLKKPLL